jgi:hypothetical protein
MLRCSLLGRLFALLGLLLVLGRGSQLDAVELLDHEGTSDSTRKYKKVR